MEHLSFVLRRASGVLVTAYLAWWLWAWAALGEPTFVRGLWTRGGIGIVVETVLIAALTLHAVDALSALRDQRSGDVVARRRHFAWAAGIALLVAIGHIPLLLGVL